MGISSPRKSKRLTEKQRLHTPHDKLQKGRDRHPRADSSARKASAGGYDGSSTDDSVQKRHSDSAGPHDTARRILHEPLRSMPSPAPKRTPEKSRIQSSLLGSPFPMLESPLNTPLMSPVRPLQPALPLFQEPSPRRGPTSPAHQFSVNYHLNSPSSTPGGDLADIMRYSFDTPASKMPQGLSLAELFASPSPRLPSKLAERAGAEDGGFSWEDLAAKLPGSHDNAPKAAVLKDAEDLSAPWVGTLLVSPSTKDVLTSLQQQPTLGGTGAPRPIIGGGVTTKRILDFNTSFDESAAAAGPCPALEATLSLLPAPGHHRTAAPAQAPLDPASSSHHNTRLGSHHSRGNRHARGSLGHHDEAALAATPATTTPAAVRPLQLFPHDDLDPSPSHAASPEDRPCSAQGRPPAGSPMSDQPNLAAVVSTVFNRLAAPPTREQAVALLQHLGVTVPTDEDSTPRAPSQQPQPQATASNSTSAFEESPPLPEHRAVAVKTEPSAPSPQAPRRQQAREQAQQQLPPPPPRVVHPRRPSRLQHQSHESSTPRSLERAMSVSSAAGEPQANVIPPQTPDEEQFGPPKNCHCKKSQCLKLYCECFAASAFCHNCSCSNCQNTQEFTAVVNERRAAIIQRNPEAFRKKITQLEGKAKGPAQHHKGCNCRKSQCLKKYCECFQNGVRCGDLCKCLDCKNFDDAAYLAQQAPPSRPGSRTAQAAQPWPQSAGPTTPFASRYRSDTGTSTPTSEKSFPDLRSILLPNSSQKLSFPSTPISNIHGPSQAGTPPTSVLSASPGTTPRNLLPPSGLHIPVARGGNVSVSLVKLSGSPSPASTHQHATAASHGGAGTQPPQHGQPHSVPRSQLHQFARQLEDARSSPRPSSSHQDGAHPHNTSGDGGRDPGGAQQQQLAAAGQAPDRQPVLVGVDGSGAPVVAEGEEGQVGVVIEMQDTETGERYRYYLPGETQLTQVVQPDGTVMLVATPTAHDPSDEPMEEAAPQHLHPSHSHHTPPHHHQHHQRAPSHQLAAPASAGATGDDASPAADGSVQVLQLPDGQLVQISGLEPGQQVRLQQQQQHRRPPQGTAEETAHVVRQLLAAAAAASGGDGSTGSGHGTPSRHSGGGGPSASGGLPLLAGKQHEAAVAAAALEMLQQQLGHELLEQCLQGARAEGAASLFSPPARQASGSLATINMVAEGASAYQGEASMSQDENEVPANSSRTMPAAGSAADHTSGTATSPVRRPHARRADAHHPHPHHPAPHHHHPAHPAPRGSPGLLHPHPRAHPPLQECSPLASPAPGRARATPTKRKAPDAPDAPPPAAPSPPQMFHDADERILAVQLPRGSASRQLSLPPPARPPAAERAAPSPPRTRASARQATSELLKEAVAKAAAAADGRALEPTLDCPVINVHGIGPVTTPTKLTLGAVGLSRLSPGLAGFVSPPSGGRRPSGQLLRISPGSTTIRPAPASAEKRHRVS